MQAEPSFQWSEPVIEFIGFASLFLANGAIGFRFAAVRDRLTHPRSATARPAYVRATRDAARLGLLGTLVQGALFILQLPRLAARTHVSVGQVIISHPEVTARSVLMGLALIGFALAARSRWSGWPMAAVALVGAELAGILTGRWAGMVNPLHQLFAGLWLGTLAVLVIAGFDAVLRHEPRAEPGPIVADLVNGFSPLALTCGPLLVITGVTTALLHLHPFSSLWTTPYGYTLLLKLCLVAVVFTLGAWNWRRQRPRLGTEEAGGLIRRSSVWELSAATLVLIVTAVLVSLPAPRRPQPPAASQPAAKPGATRFRESLLIGT
jgi:putative copper export protein